MTAKKSAPAAVTKPAKAAAPASAADAPPAGVAILMIDIDRPTGPIDQRVYGHFLEHINHSVVDGLYAEQIRGQGFEANDFRNFWQPITENGTAEAAAIKFEQGERSLRLTATGGTALHYDRRLQVTGVTAGNYVMSSFTWKTF